MHKTANVLNALPKSLQAKAKADLHELWMAPTRQQAIAAFNKFVKAYGAKYPKAVEKLIRDRDALLAFYDFPAEHWIHLRTTNPIESTFATVRHRTTGTKNCVSRTTFLGLAFKLVQEAEKSWHRSGCGSPHRADQRHSLQRWSPTTRQSAGCAADGRLINHAENMPYTRFDFSPGRTANGQLKEVMRIAYNFADDAIKVLKLLVSIADLKGVLLWCTIKEHFDMAEAFRNLPWTKSHKKPSLERYREIIGGARNRAFHNLLAFDRTIEADLEGVDVKARRLTLLPAYGRRKTTNPFDYEDREIVEILAELTRAPEAAVPFDFWKKNAGVMESFEKLLEEVRLKSV